MPINRYKTRNREEEPEINLVPFIDVLLVIIIFLAVSTSYSKLSQLSDKMTETPKTNIVSITEVARGPPGFTTLHIKGCKERASKWEEAFKKVEHKLLFSMHGKRQTAFLAPFTNL